MDPMLRTNQTVDEATKNTIMINGETGELSRQRIGMPVKRRCHSTSHLSFRTHSPEEKVFRNPENTKDFNPFWVPVRIPLRGIWPGDEKPLHLRNCGLRGGKNIKKELAPINCVANS
jgi:hypothetical protein